VRACRLIIAWIAALPASGCSCNGPAPPECPASFQIGERCEILAQECPYPGARCGTTCTCENQPGGFAWNCTVKTCACTCPCGRVAINSCEALECTTQQDPCPASAAAICGVVCVDGGRPEAGPRDLGVDRRRDAAPDLRRDLGAPDGARDAYPDLPVDAAPDLPVDAAPDLPVDAATKDQAFPER
jgi:hypothetical protein